MGEETDETPTYRTNRGLGVDSRDRILVADLRPPSVAVFTMDGEWLGSIGGVVKVQENMSLWMACMWAHLTQFTYG